MKQTGRILGFVLVATSMIFLGSMTVVKSPHTIHKDFNAAVLGEMLFHDVILSRDFSVSCASCHHAEFAFADTVKFSSGIGGQLGTRNTPSTMNVLSRTAFFWDGRAATLEEHALQPIANPKEMDLPIPEALDRLNRHPAYPELFKKVYGRKADSANLANALAEFQRTLETENTIWDRYAIHGEEIDAAVIRGKAIFDGKGQCLECHFTPDFTADELKNIGIFDGVTFTDTGRYGITGDSTDLGRFKVPGLRNVAVTAPYMHNGMFETLEEVLDFYNDTRRIIPNPVNQDPLLQKPLDMTRHEMNDVIAFLKALTDEQFLHLLE